MDAFCHWVFAVLLAVCMLEPAWADSSSTIAVAQDSAAATDDSPRQRLAGMGIGSDKLEAHADGQALELEPQSIELLMRLLMRLETWPRANIERWADQSNDLRRLAQGGQPDLRGQFVAAGGRVERVQQVELGPADAERFQFERYYRCTCLLGSPETPAVVYARYVPAAWLKTDSLNERVALSGLYLGRGAAVGDDDSAILVANRIAWFPDTPLGDLKVDVGLLDEVAHGKPLAGNDEEEGFYQLLAAAGRMEPAETLSRARQELAQRRAELKARRGELGEREAVLQKQLSAAPANAPEAAAQEELKRVKAEMGRVQARIDYVESGASELIPFLEDPARQAGRLSLVRCLARRIVDIKVSDADARRRLGLDHYYQVDGLATLEMTVRLPVSRQTPDGMVTEMKELWSHPVTFCVLTLPAGLAPGDHLHTEIIVPAFYFKNWSYDTADGETGRRSRGVAPLFVAREPIVQSPIEEPANSTAALFAVGLFATIVVSIGIALWRANRGDRRFASQRAARQWPADGVVSLNELNLNVTDEPSFRHLEESHPDQPAP